MEQIMRVVKKTNQIVARKKMENETDHESGEKTKQTVMRKKGE